jgi:hypothetical protein
MTQEEVAERERAIDVFMAHVALAEDRKDANVSLSLKDAIEIRDELERLEEIERRYDDAMSAAEDRRWD